MQQDRLLPIVSVLSCLAWVSTACCAGDSNYLTFGIGSGSGHMTVLWGDTMELGDPVVEVSFPREESLAGEPLEVWQEDERLAIAPIAEDVDNRANMGCGWSTNLIYDLRDLPGGSYTLVYRRGSGTGGAINCLGSCPWTEFQGDRALTMVLFVLDPPATADVTGGVDGSGADIGGIGLDAAGQVD